MPLATTFRSLVLSAWAAVLSLAGAPAAHAQTFSNPAVITIPGSGPASLYPSPIVVTGVPAPITYVTVTLSGYSHIFNADVIVLLVSPTDQRILLMANTNGGGSAVNDTLTFIPDGGVVLPSTSTDVVSGVYACSVYNAPSALPAPAPAGPYGTSLAPLIGTNANGTWNLYVFDDEAGISGSVAGGWSLGLSTTPLVPVGTAFTYQGVLSASGVPINGNANVRFTLSNSATDPTAISTVVPPITRTLTGISNGQVTTTLDFGAAIDTNQARWLNIEVESPPGSGFVTLTPRQPITPTPQARRAANADFATSTRGISVDAVNRVGIGTVAPVMPLQVGDQGLPGSVGMIRLGSRGATGSAFRSFDLGVVNGGADTTGSNYSFVIADTIRGATVPDFMIRYDSGNVGIGTNTPTERLTVNGSAQINTGTLSVPTRLAFGPVGNLGASAESTDAMYFQRVNPASNSSDLRLYIGDDPNAGAGADAFSIWVTNGTPSSGTERFRFTSDGNAFKTGGGSWTALSDPRAKHDIAPLHGTLDKLLTLRGYSFLYNDDRIATGQARPGTQFGLMADEVARVFPDWVSTDASGTRYVTERATTALMVEALRDLRAEKDRQIDDLKADAAKREAENADLKARLAAIEAALLKMTKNSPRSKGDK